MCMACFVRSWPFSSYLFSFPPCEKSFGAGALAIFAAAFPRKRPLCDTIRSIPKRQPTDDHEDSAPVPEDNEAMTSKDGEILTPQGGKVTTTEDAVLVRTTDDVIQVTHPEDVSGTSTEGKSDLDRLPIEVLGGIFEYFPYELFFQVKLASNKLKGLVESNLFRALSLREKPKLTASYLFVENGDLQWAGFDLTSKKWRRMPSLDLKFLPADCKPDPDLFKEFLVCAKDGLVCINFSKSADEERLIVLNPLSRKYRELPPLNHRRNPVLIHMLVDPASQLYQVIVAGSSKSGDEDLSKITEVYDSHTGKWKRTGDLLGPAYALNEYQSGVFQDGKLFCLGFVEENGEVSKGILGYDVEEGKWSSRWTHPLHFCTLSSTILQLVESHGELYLFSERENGRSVEHWVERVEWAQGNGEEKITCMLVNVIQKQKIGGRSLEVYPEYVCVPYNEGHLCILNAIDHTGVVYDIRDQGQSEFPLETLPETGFRGELGFFSLNPMSFTFEPKFSSKV
jgi:hypothetical protein